MKSKKKSKPKPSAFRRVFRTLKVVLIAAALSTVYIYLPESLTQKVVDVSPHLDRTLAAAGFYPSLLIDSLPIWGKETHIPCSEPEWYALCRTAPTVKRTQRLDSPGFFVGYSEALRNPLWVKYRLFDVESFKRGKRPGRFKTDDRTLARISHDDYTHSGYDRGHMAPNFGIATRYGREGQLATFSMSNIIPQTPTVNRNVWKEIEMLNAKNYGRCFGEILVITGPVFDKNPERLKNGVCVPEAYYKIVLDRTGDELRALAFLLPADSRPTRRLNSALVSIDEIEERTGVNFLTALSRADQKKLESAPAPHIWFSLPDQIRYHLAK